uniref:PS II complex 12 kDa extrinsic protein n=1 Tax=Coccolithus braarudii TaxID=221442 RepID=A0A7S0LC77_9EUKA|mmetsp:Transcript_32745/g.70198  ORF Transcript_32745/g.70198 Transcript_32745/m.70198 type:complete len:162 (+) Transcript_32745:10-495(+)
MLRSLSCFVVIAGACALRPPLRTSHHSSNRRRHVLVSAGAACAMLTVGSQCIASTRETLSAPGSAERCEGGEGDACTSLAEGNALILQLQARSRQNKEKNERELYDKTVRQLGYTDYFDALDKNLVQLPDGKYTLLDPAEYGKLRKEGKIKIGSIDQLLVD